MKKTFLFTAPNKQPERQCDSVKYEIRKYIARERRKKLPEGVDYWDFDCRIGASAESAEVIHVAEINKRIDILFNEKQPSFYVEILAKQGIRKKRPQAVDQDQMNDYDDEDFEDDDYI